MRAANPSFVSADDPQTTARKTLACRIAVAPLDRSIELFRYRSSSHFSSGDSLAREVERSASTNFVSRDCASKE